jgi:polyisoprenoid-binding protein YceI
MTKEDPMAWQIDTSHSSIEFAIRHMMLAKTRGRFNTFSGTVELNEEHPTKSWVDVTIEVASIETRDEKRDAHLRSTDFFDAEKYPYITFKSKKVEQTSDRSGKIYGDLTIKDVTNEVVLDVEYIGSSKSPWGTTSYGFSASTRVSRADWGLTWNVALETGGWLVGDEVTIDIQLEVVKVEAPVEAAAAA